MLELNEVQLFKGDPENIWGEQIKQPENILSMEVTEVMNGSLTLSMVCAISDYNIENLVIGNIIKCYKDVLKKTMFSFEIYDVKYTIDHKITVKAEHLSSRLRYIYVEPIGYIDFDEISGILSGYSSAEYKLINHTGESIVKIRVPNTINDYGVVSNSIKSIADHMKGTTGSILDHFGGGYWRYNEDTEMEFYKENQVNDKDPELEPIKYSVNMLIWTTQNLTRCYFGKKKLMELKNRCGHIRENLLMLTLCKRHNYVIYLLNLKQSLRSRS